MTVLNRALGVIALTTLLAACGTQTPRATDPASTSLVPLSLHAGELATVKNTGLGAQGVPFKDGGTSAVQSVHVKVYQHYSLQGPNTPLHFDADGNQDPNGSRDYVELTPQAETTTIRLHPGTYDIEATGLTTTNGGVALAYQLLSHQSVNQSADATPSTVTFHLSTLIGDVSLEPVLPVNYVIPGQVLDLNLVVRTDEVPGGKRYVVPLSDFTFSSATGSETRNVTVLNSSQLGERIKITAPEAGSEDTDVFLVQTVQGLADPAPVTATFKPTFSRPYYSVTTLGVDLERPTVQVIATDYRGLSLIGLSPNDNVGIARVEIYEGVLLVASSDIPDSFDQDGLLGPLTYYADPSVAHDYTVVVQDTSGNEIRKAVHVDIAPPYNPPAPPTP